WMVDDVHIDRHPLALSEQVGNVDWRDGDFLFHSNSPLLENRTYFLFCQDERTTFFELGEAPNGLRYAPSGALVGGAKQRHFDGTNSKPRRLPPARPEPAEGGARCVGQIQFRVPQLS